MCRFNLMRSMLLYPDNIKKPINFVKESTYQFSEGTDHCTIVVESGFYQFILNLNPLSTIEQIDKLGAWWW